MPNVMELMSLGAGAQGGMAAMFPGMGRYQYFGWWTSSTVPDDTTSAFYGVISGTPVNVNLSLMTTLITNEQFQNAIVRGVA